MLALSYPEPLNGASYYSSFSGHGVGSLLLSPRRRKSIAEGEGGRERMHSIPPEEVIIAFNEKAIVELRLDS